MTDKRPIIGMILDNDFPPDPRVENEAKTLIKSGFDVKLFSFSYSREFLKQENHNGIEVYRYYCSRFLFKLSALAYSLPFYHWLLKRPLSDFISQVDCDFVHVHDIQVARAVFLIQPKFHFRIVLDLHENRPEIMKYYKHVNSFPLKYLVSPDKWKKYEEIYAKKSDGVVVVTGHAKKELVERTGINEQKVVVAPNVVDFTYGSEQSFNQEIVNRYENQFVLLYVGDTSKRRGLEVAIKAMTELKGKVEGLKLVIVGSSSFDHELQRLVDKEGVSDLVDLLGWQDFELFPSYIKASNICISPLQRNIHHDTTYANKLFQYMSLGGVLLVSDCDAQQDLVNETKTGLIFKDGSVDDFVEKTLELYNNQPQRAEYSENGINAVSEKFNWERTGGSLVKYYEELVAS